MISAVLFDLDGTLLPLSLNELLPRFMSKLVRYARETIGVDVTAATAAATALLLRSDGSRTNAQVFWTAAAAQLGRSRLALEKTYTDFVLQHGQSLAEGVHVDRAAREVVAACRKSGMRVALATNPNCPRVFIEERLRWADLMVSQFDFISSLEEMHFCKPRPEYFHELLAILRLHPNECLMVGNDTVMDLAPAAAVGMRTCLVLNEFVVRGDQGFKPDHACPLADVPALLHAPDAMMGT